MRLEAEGNGELRLNPVRPQSVKWELHGKKMKTDSYLSRRRKKVKNGRNFLQVLATHLFNRYLLNIYYTNCLAYISE